MNWTSKQLNDVEESVAILSQATGLLEKEIVDVIVDGLAMKYKGKIPANFLDLIDELRATFDAY